MAILALDTRSVSGTKTGNGHWRRLDHIQTREELRINFEQDHLEKRVLQWRKSKASEKMFMHDYNKTDGKLGFFNVPNSVASAVAAVWVSGQALTSDRFVSKNQVSHGIPKGIPAFTKVWPNKPGRGHGATENTEKPVALGCLCFFWHILLLTADFQQILETNCTEFFPVEVPPSFTGN